jgi:hypothetical protein
MKTLGVCLLLLVGSLPCLGQESYSLEGTVGSGMSSSPQAYTLWLEGKTHFSPYLSAGIGLGLWQTGYKDTWITDHDDVKATHYRLSDFQTIPALSLSVRGEYPLINLGDQPLRLFLEPQLIGLPYTGRTVKLEENYLLFLDPNANPPTYKPRPVDPTYEGSYKYSGGIQLGWALKGGLAYQMNERVDYFLSVSYQSIDPFASLKNQTLATREDGVTIDLDTYRPQKPFLFLHLGFAYRFE